MAIFARSKDGIQALCSLDHHNRSKTGACLGCGAVSHESTYFPQHSKAQSCGWDPPGAREARHIPVPSQIWRGIFVGGDFRGNEHGANERNQSQMVCFYLVQRSRKETVRICVVMVFASEEKAVQTAKAWRKTPKKLQNIKDSGEMVSGI